MINSLVLINNPHHGGQLCLPGFNLFLAQVPLVLAEFAELHRVVIHGCLLVPLVVHLQLLQQQGFLLQSQIVYRVQVLQIRLERGFCLFGVRGDVAI